MSAASAFAEERAAIRAKLQGIGSELERLLEQARNPDSPAHAELSVRTSYRHMQFIARQAKHLQQIREPEPHATHPTRERANQTADRPHTNVVYKDGQPDAVIHRWLWPVEQARRRWLLSADQVSAAARFRRAFLDSQRMPSPTLYSDAPPSNPTNRNGLTPANMLRQARALALAGGEAGFVWKRLEDELRAIAWALILEEPFPGKSSPMGLVEMGRGLARIETDRDARWFVYGSLRITCERLVSIYRIFDSQPSRQRGLA